MKLETGSILTGKVTGITKFGAFVSVAPGKSGLVHISEIANTYVSDIHEFLSEGQEVTVKIINIDDNGRLNLSIKAALPQSEKKEEPRRERPRNTGYTKPAAPAPAQQQEQAQPQVYVPQPSSDASFEDKLKRFMQDSDSKMAGVRQYSERKTRSRRR
ncbi:MAG: S1 RNA-binding domain-containing protein [Oscillospiraceae bacterium]|nr:S1 RNA-binding domain-containing protein [Oscillospiraceae bacterium]MBQ9857598.1 S1 RNA-binding domain-containing protein [Oscillospiraceae bacterium]